MDEAVQRYIDAIPAEHRPLFDRLHHLILSARPDTTVVLSYDIPTYKAGKRRLYLGAWQHGISMYGWGKDRAAAFLERHPQLKSGKGTIRLKPEDSARISDKEFAELIRAALED